MKIKNNDSIPFNDVEMEGAKNVKVTAFQDNHLFKNSRNEIAQVIIEWIKTTTRKSLRDL